MKTLGALVLMSLICIGPLAAQRGGRGGGEGADPFSGLRLRSIGPASASGRVTSFAVNPENPAEYYVGVASGGVWKTLNNGITWTPVFDNEGSYSIGTVTLDPKNPSTVWVGTGENNSQRSVSWGDGIYRSDDGGRSWRHLGLENSQHIARIAIDPRDSSVVYVASQGPLWSSGGDRGVFKTTDGGKTWKNVLTISENTGVTDIAIDPTDPDRLLAASYQRARRQWTLIDGGPESEIYKSDDAGKTWRRVRAGLPQGDVGRIGVTFSPAQAHLVYAKIEASNNQSGFYVSHDSGESWERRAAFEGTPMYYGQIIADPKNPEKFYAGDTNFRVSDDGGRTVRILGDRNKHVDSHTIWIDPRNTDHIFVGCDGGVYESWDGGQFWNFKANLPTLQFYDVDVDYAKPFYNVYGGTQDNFSWGGPSATRNLNGIMNSDWYVTTGGDGFVSRVDPQDPDTVYAESQGGGMVRYNRKTGSRINIKPIDPQGEAPLRWNWDAPLIVSPHNHLRLYFGANKLFQSDDRGNTWKAISPDLTKQLDRNALPIMGKIWGPDAVAKNASTAFYGNISAISESPKREGLLFAGTDDGNIQVEDDQGGPWRKADLSSLPEHIYVQRILASQHDENVVYAALDNHQNGDFKPYLLKSTDRGKTWTNISAGLPQNGPVMSIAEDFVNPKLLFAGTEYGLFFSIDGGEKWTRLRGGLPTIEVRDMVIQKREGDLVLATFGRGFYVLDDYSPLRTATPETLGQEAVLFPVKNALEYVQASPIGGRGKGFQGESFYSAENPPFGATFTYYLRDGLRTKAQIRRDEERAAERDNKPIHYPTADELRAETAEEAPSIEITIMDASGKIVRRMNGPVARGIHRASWDLRGFAPVVPGGGGRGGRGGGGGGGEEEGGGFFGAPAGHFVPAGKYKVAIAKRVDGKTTQLASAQTFEVINDGAQPPTEFLDKVSRLQSAVSGALEEANAAKQRLTAIRRALDDSAADAKLMDERDALDHRLDALLLQLSGDAALRRRQENVAPSISQRANAVANETRGLLEPPTKSQQDEYAIAAAQFEQLLPKLRALIETDLRKFERELDAAHVPLTPGRFPEWK
ncbi:MAG TPA: hypothetical protein VMG40_18605 [Bryobacteraceae bacterium]|nr:hypothetical protein [Bryobacteraceae bacterium]